MPTVDVSGISIYFEIHGSGPRVLNVSGTGGDLRRTRPDLSPLNDHFTVLSYDQRGLGRTSKPESEYTMADYADDAAALVAANGWERCHVIGTSFGGMVALNLAVRHPDVIDRLVLNCTAPGGAHASYPLHELFAGDRDAAVTAQLGLMDERADPESDEPIPGLGEFGRVMVDAMRRPLTPDVDAGLQRQLAARAGHDVTGQLETIDAPTLICAGRYDLSAPLANSEFMLERIPRADLAIFEGGHLFMLQDPGAFPTIIDFLS